MIPIAGRLECAEIPALSNRRSDTFRCHGRPSGTADAALPPVAVRAALLTLRVDNVTTEVVTAMHEVGIRTLLLKGPSIVAWLYRDGAARAHVDTDLFVATGSYRQAGDVLRALGFRPLGHSPCWSAFAASGRGPG